MTAFAIDAFDFGRLNEERQGVFTLAELPRLVQECTDDGGSLAWAITGGTHASGHLQLIVTVTGTVSMLCQRCLKPFAFEIDSRSTLVLANDEAQADQIEAMLDDEDLDVIVGSRTMNLRDLIEDEALLAIPQSPRHEQCPTMPGESTSQPQQSQDETIVVKPSPFAVLKNLKH